MSGRPPVMITERTAGSALSGRNASSISWEPAAVIVPNGGFA